MTALQVPPGKKIEKSRKNRDSSKSSSPSPAKERGRSSPAVRDDHQKKSKLRPGLVSTVRLYSNSPSPPPQLEAWKNKEKKKDGIQRKDQEEDDVVNTKPNNEKERKMNLPQMK